MGVWNRIKKAFDHGGITVDLTVAKTFRWSDDVLGVGLTVTNKADEPRAVTSIRLQLVEYDRENPATTRKVRGRYEGKNLFLKEPFVLEPGAERTIRADMPISLSGAADELGGDRPDWLAGVSGLVNTVTELNRDSEWYLLRVIPEVEGFSAQRIASRRLRNLRAGEWGGGVVTTRIND